MDGLATPASLRHDLRTPLNQIIGYSEMLIEDSDGAGAPELSAQIAHVRTYAFSLLKLIQDLIPPSSIALDKHLTQALKDGLRAPGSALLSCTEALALRDEPWLAPFAGHIRTAARDLVEFIDGAGLPPRDSQDEVVAAPSAAASKANLLVVDDSQRNREMLSRQLERQGYTVFSAGNGREALQFLRAGPFDLVLLDVLMPEVDGFAALEQIKSDPHLRDIPVVMISASDEYQSVIRCIESGAEDYLPKPFDPVLLRARIKASLEKKFLRDEQRRRSEELERAYRDLQKMQDQLITQEKLASLGALAAGIAHEIRNPLNFVSNFAALSGELIGELRAAIESAETAEIGSILIDLEDNVRKIEEHGKRADRIVRGMLMHSRKQSGDREPIDLNAMVAEYANLAYHGLRTQDMAFNSAIEMDLDPAVGRVPVFPQDLSRVFLNIAANAFHAVHEQKQRLGDGYHPAVRFQTRVAGETVEIRIRDNGPGIPADLRSRIFEPFFTTRPAGSGTGLGLSISHEVVVKEHGGELRVESEPGQFAEFIVRLPRHVQ